jgi:hypothetical protein
VRAPASPRHSPLGPHAEASPWSVGPCAAFGTAMPPPCSPSPRAPRVPAAPPNQWPRRRTPPHVVAVRAPCRPWVAIGRRGGLANRLSSSRPSIKGRRCSPASSIFRVCSVPTNYPKTSTRIPCSPSGRLLSRPDRRFAGARAPAAATALRRRVPTPAWSSAQPEFRTGAHKVVEHPTATSCLGRRASSPEQA